jgi:hypothetical protein
MVGCAARTEPARTRAPAAPKPLPAPVVVSALWQQSQAWPTSTDTWFVARGHYASTSEALVRISPAAQERYEQHTLGSEFEPGSTFVMLHRSRATGKRGPIHVMEKGPSGWKFQLLDANGIVNRQARLSLCARCHAEAASDFVFGPARLTVAE